MHIKPQESPVIDTRPKRRCYGELCACSIEPGNEPSAPAPCPLSPTHICHGRTLDLSPPRANLSRGGSAAQHAYPDPGAHDASPSWIPEIRSLPCLRDWGSDKRYCRSNDVLCQYRKGNRLERENNAGRKIVKRHTCNASQS